MKVISGNRVWVQKYNLSNLLKTLESLSIRVNDKVIIKIYGDVFICTEDTMYDFVDFEGKEMVEFFKSLDFIIDYYDVKDKSFNELVSLEKKIREDALKQASEVSNAKGQKICHAAYLKLCDIDTYLGFLKGYLNYTIPLRDENNLNNEEQNNTSEGKGFLYRIKRTLRRKRVN